MSNFDPDDIAETITNEYLTQNGWPGSTERLVHWLERAMDEYADSECTYYDSCKEIVDAYGKMYGQHADEALAGRSFAWDERNEANQAAAYYIARAAIEDSVRSQGEDLQGQITDVVGDMDCTEWVEGGVHESDLAFYEDMPFNPFREGEKHTLDEDVEEEMGVYKWDDPTADLRKLMAELDCGLWVLHVCDIPYHKLDEED
jgi:hypothetical protein